MTAATAAPTAADIAIPAALSRIAAFADAGQGGNPAGVLIADAMPPEAEMQAIAAAVGYSETAFAAQEGDRWRVRYFSPEAEVPFCGHATIALGAALAAREGDGTFPLRINGGDISVEGRAAPRPAGSRRRWSRPPPATATPPRRRSPRRWPCSACRAPTWSRGPRR